MIYIQDTGYIFGYIEVTFFENVTENVTFQEKRHKKIATGEGMTLMPAAIVAYGKSCFV